VIFLLVADEHCEHVVSFGHRFFPPYRMPVRALPADGQNARQSSRSLMAQRKNRSSQYSAIYQARSWNLFKVVEI
jgi:hypothetical protein